MLREEVLSLLGAPVENQKSNDNNKTKLLQGKCPTIIDTEGPTKRMQTLVFLF